jgi:hypothetical protein
VAATETGRALTEQHRKAQLQIRAQALQDYTRLWPVWEGDEGSFVQMVLATIVLVKGYQVISSQTAGNYFQSFRIAEGAKGEARTKLADPVDEEKVRAALFATGQLAVKQSLESGKSAEHARGVALTQTSGAVSTQILNGGRETILQSVGDDKAALGWCRVTDGDPCAFCALLAGRGPIYKEEATADFQAHGNDGCTAEPVYSRDAEWPGRAREFHDLYNEAIFEADEAGELDPSNKNYLLNAFRRKYEAQRHAA